ncbi:kinase-associated lipoprotein B [Siminovitchia sp. FSL W7-1587]|uniref:kinase-associated lipoprotein B n=1 Tax=Siminovitchia sp. FSL W7-1587 TaxID=2954699 RepID=UPI0030CC5047
MEIGQIVKAFKKTGTYIGEITTINPDTYTVRIMAVLKHPIQGDLHNPRQADVPFFPGRKALAYREQTNVPANMVRPFEGPVPNYKKSLLESVQKLYDELSAKPEDPYCSQSLEMLYESMKDYELMYSIEFPALRKS